jgi:hypothetical protein
MRGSIEAPGHRRAFPGASKFTAKLAMQQLPRIDEVETARSHGNDLEGLHIYSRLASAIIWA